MTSLPPPNAVLSVSSLNRLVRDCLESSFPLTWISGEISNLTYASSGHVYFSLKDASAQVRCVMWRNRAQLLGWRLENGQKIEARALVSFYEPRGEFQLNIEMVRRAGQGELFERFLQLKARLEAEGLFSPERRRPLPAYPQRLAIVTSPQAAALHDVLNTLRRRAPHLHLDLYPCPVQGQGAAEKIAQAIADAARGEADAILLCRGGGSIEDLWAFNEECVARAIRASRLPLVSGIGHETDFTIADFAADLRAPTPTAAAELLSPEREVLLARLQQLHRQLTQSARRVLEDKNQALDWQAIRLVHPAERLARRSDELGQLARRLQQGIEQQSARLHYRLQSAAQALHGQRPKLDECAARLQHSAFRLANASRWQISESARKLNLLAGSLKQLDPHAVLSRGYALAIGPDGHIVRDAADLSVGTPLQLSFARGRAKVTVDQLVADQEAQ